jgi:hypothetical protein
MLTASLPIRCLYYATASPINILIVEFQTIWRSAGDGKMGHAEDNDILRTRNKVRTIVVAGTPKHHGHASRFLHHGEHRATETHVPFGKSDLAVLSAA